LEFTMLSQLDQELAALQRLSLADLRAKFAALYGEASRHTNNRIWLIRRIAWRWQALAEGSLSERARRRAEELANDADLRSLPPRSTQPASTTRSRQANRLGLEPGAVVTRLYKGQTLEVTVLPLGFQFEGQVYRSLSALARMITGSHCSGRRFFGLTAKGRKR
jgi:hypothetical protein